MLKISIVVSFLGGFALLPCHLLGQLAFLYLADLPQVLGDDAHFLNCSFQLYLVFAP
jgi:hypothetical protein